MLRRVHVRRPQLANTRVCHPCTAYSACKNCGSPSINSESVPDTTLGISDLFEEVFLELTPCRWALADFLEGSLCLDLQGLGPLDLEDEGTSILRNRETNDRA